MKGTIIRLIMLPAGLFMKLAWLARDGSRDIFNRLRFRGAIIDHGCRIDNASRIQKYSHIFEDCLINNSSVSSHTYVGRNSILQNTSIGKFCSVANDVFTGPGRHPLNEFSTSPVFYRVSNPLNIKLVDSDSSFSQYQMIEIGNDVWIGTRAIIMDGVRISDGAVIAANSVVTKDVPPYSICAGVPARVIRYRFSPEKIKYLLDLSWWNWDLHKIRAKSGIINEFLNDQSNPGMATGTK